MRKVRKQRRARVWRNKDRRSRPPIWWRKARERMAQCLVDSMAKMLKTEDICTVEPHHENEYECMDTYCALHKNKTCLHWAHHIPTTACTMPCTSLGGIAGAMCNQTSAKRRW